MADAREAVLRRGLTELAKRRLYHQPTVQITPLPPTGANFTSQLFHCVVSSPGKKDAHLFAKVAAVGETLRAQSPTKIFDIERYVYSTLTKVYGSIEDEHDIPEEARLVFPKYFGCSDAYLEEFLVIQNMAVEGFTTYDRFKSIDWEYASKAVEELAKLHALSMAYRKQYPADYEEETKVLKRELLADDPAMMGVIKQMIERVMAGVREENREKLKRFMAGMLQPEALVGYYAPRRREVLIHSDFRQSNLMHKVHEDGTTQVVIVDYQTMHPGCAANDLLYFVFTGSDAAFRRQHYHRLLDHYYEHLCQALKRLHLDPQEMFPREDFDQEVKDTLPFGLMVACMMLPMITMDAAQLPASGQSESIQQMADMLGKSNELCVARVNEVVDDYVAWGLL